MNSVSNGCVRSPLWASNGVVGQVLVSSATLPGNSGGGVFHAVSHELIGLTSWRTSDEESLNGLVPAYCVAEAVRMLATPSPPAAPLPVPAPTFNRNDYALGVSGRSVHMSTKEAYRPAHPAVGARANVGFLVWDVQPGSAAEAAGLAYYTFLWAVAPDRGGGDVALSDWIPLTEDTPLDAALFAVYSARWHARLPRRASTRAAVSSGELAMTDDDPLLQETLSVALLTTSAYDEARTPVVVRTALPRRHAAVAALGDPTTWQNQFVTTDGSGGGPLKPLTRYELLLELQRRRGPLLTDRP
jgi:hypothetical protein